VADVVEAALVVVEAEEERAERAAVLVQPVADHDAVGRPLVLHLDPAPFAGKVGLLP